MMRRSKKKEIEKNSKKKKKKRGLLSKLAPFISRLMPYILAVLFVLMLFTLVGGLAFSKVLYGLFSKHASYFILVFILYHSLMWYHDTKRKICTRRVCCSLVIVIAVSMIQHLTSDYIFKIVDGVEVTTPITELYTLGTELKGGGAIGGGLCGLLVSLVGKGFTIAIILVILAFMFLQMFNITPVSIFKRIFKNRIEEKRAIKERERKRAQLAKKHKKFIVFDDDEDTMVAPAIDERILEAMNEPDIDDESDYEEEKEPEPVPQRQDSFEIERRPVTEQTYKQPIQRSASPYRFTPEPKVEPQPVNQQSEPTFNTGDFVLNAPAYKVSSDVGSNDNYSNSYDDFEQEETTPSSYEPVPPRAEYTPTYAPTYTAPTPPPQPTNVAPVEGPVAEPTPAPVQPTLVVTTPAPSPLPKVESNPVIHDMEKEEPAEKKSLFSGLFKREKPVEEEKPKDEPKAKEPPKPKKDKKKKHIFPPIDFFELKSQDEDTEAVNEELQEKARIIVDTLKSFNAATKSIEATRGPTVTRYELVPEAGVRVRSIANLVDDIALNLAASGIRMECPIPGKSAVGIEVPNDITSMVYLRSLLEDPKFKQAKSPVTCAVGKSIAGENVYIDIAKMPHLLVAGATGMGKSVCINALLISLLYKASPEDLRLILIDPKRVEFSPYNGIPHLLVPVVCEVKKSIGTLQWAVTEMERRFEILEASCVRDIGEYNDRVDRGAIDADKFARIVIVIDELYDLKMQVPEIDDYIIRLTQKARAAGIHVIIGTQRPSVDVITGVIKANIPSRIAFRVPAQVDSRTILDEVGAEKLVARGDMLLKPVGALKPIRVQGAFITDDERERVTNFLKENSSENYDEEVISMIESNAAKLQKAEKKSDADDGSEGNGSDLDEKFYAALEIATDMGKISSSYLQRKLNLGFQRAARIIDQMEALGYIGEANGSKPRDVLITKQDFQELMMKNDD